MKLFYALACMLLICSSKLKADEVDEEATDVDSLKHDAKHGLSLALKALNTLIFGVQSSSNEEPYKDPFVDTSKSIFDQLGAANDQITLDDLLRLFVQTILILIGNQRTDLFPDNFNDANPAFGESIKHLNEILELLLNKGSGDVKMSHLKPLIANLQKDEFWASLSKLNSIVADKIETEKLEKLSKNATKEEL